MTVTDFMNRLIIDPKLKISIQTRDKGRVTELYNSEKLFNGASDTAFENEIQYIKMENESIFILV